MKIANTATARVAVALPKILTEINGVMTDTVFIRSDSMIVSKDLRVYLQFYDDANDDESMDLGLIDSAGYKYKSRWIANANLTGRDTIYHKPYYRQFPANSTAYRWWNKTADSCLVSFRHDSLYAVGGKLTIECVGALNSIKAIDNRFSVVTDSIPFGTIDSIQMKVILIDRDPANSLFRIELNRDRIRAVAWQEYAGWGDNTHCHNPDYNPRWNHYWDDRISRQDTCRDTKTPCENSGWTDTGVMQIIRIYDTTSTSGWESWFSRAGNKPNGYAIVAWDSLAWNWKINCFNGRYIHDSYMPYKFTTEQKAFPESCSFADCDTFPTKKNKEDLKSYGYHRGDPEMKRIINDKNWKDYIADTVHHYEYSVYVQNVRRYKYRRPWQ